MNCNELPFVFLMRSPDRHLFVLTASTFQERGRVGYHLSVRITRQPRGQQTHMGVCMYFIWETPYKTQYERGVDVG